MLMHINGEQILCMSNTSRLEEDEEEEEGESREEEHTMTSNVKLEDE